jgi:hypothetical protein
MDDEFDLFNDSVQGLMDGYEDDFDDFVDDFLDLDQDPVEKVVDPITKKTVSAMYSFCQSNFSNFQNPYAIAGHQLGQIIYSSVRDAEQLDTGKSFGKLIMPNYSLKKLDQDTLNFWTVAGMLEKALAGEQTLDYVKQSGSLGIANVVRSSTIEIAKTDRGVKKHAILKTSAGACDFCLSIAKFVLENDNPDRLSKAKFHLACNCALVYVFD